MSARAGRLVLPAGAPREQWLAARREGITATDVVEIVGLSRYGDPISVYLDKRLGEDDRDPGEAARWGRLLEDQVAREWARRAGRQVRRVGLVRSPTHPHHLATCDRRILREHASLECKTRTAWSADEWDDGAGGVTVPDRVAVQAQWQMHVWGDDHVHVAALIGGQQLVSAELARDQVLIDYLAAAADQVWAAVQDGVPPDVPAWQLSAASLERLHPDRGGTVDVDPAEAQPLIDAYRAALAAERAVQAEKDVARLALIRLLGDGEAALVDQRPAYSYRRSADQTVIPAASARALLAAHPDLAAEYAVIKPGQRTFRLAKEK